MPQDVNEQPKNVAENIDVESQEQAPKKDAPTEKKSGDSDVDKIVEKLQKRIGKEQSEKHSLQDQIEKLTKENEKLKSGASIKELSDKEKAQQAESDKDKTIADLNAQINRMKAITETDAVFKESGLAVGDEILGMVVARDSETTLANAKALIGLVDKVKADARKEALKGSTPRVQKDNGMNSIEKALGLK